MIKLLSLSFARLSLVCFTILTIAACGGGGGGSNGNGGAPPPPGGSQGTSAGFEDGAVGTGFSAGPIKDLGQIIVADRVIDPSMATVFVEGATSQSSSLEFGQQIAIIEDWQSAQALEIHYRATIRGELNDVYVVDSDIGYASIRVLDQLVRVEARTAFKGGGINDLSSGALLEVSGSVDETGAVRASYIEFLSTLPEFKLIGVVSDANQTSFKIGELTIDYTGANLIGFGSGISENDRIEVRGSAGNYSPQRLVAQAVEKLPDLTLLATTPLEIDGLITQVDSANRFRLTDVVGVRVVDTSGATVVGAVGTSPIAPGNRVRVAGTMSANGVLTAERVTVGNSELVRWQGPLTGADATTGILSAGSLDLSVNPVTSFTDDSSIGMPQLTISDLGAGDYVVLTGYVADAQVIVTDVRRMDPLSEAVFIAPADVLNATGEIVEILGVSYTVNGSTSILDANGDVTSRSSLFSQIQPGQTVSLRWNVFASMADAVDVFSARQQAFSRPLQSMDTYYSGCTRTVSDGFARNSLGSDWVPMNGSTPTIFSNEILGIVNNEPWLFVRRAASLSADQFAEAEIAPNKADFMLVQVFARLRVGDSARYGFHYNDDTGMNRWEIKYDGVPTPQTKILATLGGSGTSGGDRLRLRATGRNPVLLSAYVNDRLMLEVQDSSAERIIDGFVGVVSRRSSQIGFVSGDTPILDSFSAGDCP